VTECFFLAMSLVYVGLLPALERCQRLHDDLVRKTRLPPLPDNASAGEYAAQLQAVQGAGLGTQQAMVLGYKLHVEGEALSALHGRYACLVSAWLTHLSTLPDSDAHPLFAKLPEHTATSSCALVRSLAFSNPTALQMSPWARPLVSRFMCEMLVRKDLITSPFTRYQFIDALHALASFDEHQEKVYGGRMISLSLFDMVDGRAAAAAQPALLSLYVELGMHTNADAVTDKNSQRWMLMKVLRRLWQQPTAWTALQALAAVEAQPASATAKPEGSAAEGQADFGEYATTLVKENIFLLDDALGRLTDVKKHEAEKADVAAWEAQPARQKADREKRLEAVRRTAKSFLDLGKASLSALLLLVGDATIGKAFTDVDARAHKMAAMLLEFLTRLCGPECQNLNVQDRDKLGWRPRRMLADTTLLLLACFERSPAFLPLLRAHDAFEQATVERAYTILSTKCLSEFPPTKLTPLQSLITQLRSLDAAASAGTDGTGGGGAAAGSVSERALALATAASKAEPPADMLKRIDAAYVAALRPLAYTDAELEDANGRYSHYYRQNIADNPAEGMSRTKLKRLMKELGKLQKSDGAGAGGEGALPVASEAAVFLLQDENRMDVLKCLISGPADVLGTSETPYALGLFEFHIFMPSDYPAVSPLVNLQTTGDGMVRFNPNLYSDGKVCLSLLGTWHGEGWMVPTASNFGSTILQVLVSIQSIIMVPKPYFNEPGYAEEEGTVAGEERSREYNENIRLATMRHAMRDMLRRPPMGMEDVVRKHFITLRPMLERQLAAWLNECKAERSRAAMEKAYVEIMSLIDEAQRSAGGAGTSSDGAGGEGGAPAADAMDIS